MIATTLLAPHWTVVGGLILLGAYVVGAFIFDRCLATRPSRDLLVRTLNGYRNCRGRPAPPDGDPAAARHAPTCETVNAAVDAALGGLQSGRQRTRSGVAPGDNDYALFIATGEVLAGWREAHRIERLCWGAAPYPAIKERLATAQSELGVIKHPKHAVPMAAELSTRIKTQLAAPVPEQCTALLDEVLVQLHDWRDSTYEGFADAQTKGAWFAILLCGMIVLAGVTEHREMLLFAGAAGGVLSRISRFLKHRPGVFEYGVSASSFLLSPLVGALSGWIGVLLISGLANMDVLSFATFGKIWNHPDSAKALTIAFAFGFVERLLDRFATSAADALNGSSSTATASAATAGTDAAAS